MPRDRWPRAARSGWYRIENAADPRTASVAIYDEIGWYGITADDFNREIKALDVDTIDLHVNSRGGDVFDGVAIHNALRNHPAKVNVTVDGIAASAASYIAMAGDHIVMGRGSQMMIHNARVYCEDAEASALRAMADRLDRIGDTIASFYVERAGGTAEQWLAAMAAETWYTGEEAVAAGLADEYVGAKTRIAAVLPREKAPPPDPSPPTEDAPQGPDETVRAFALSDLIAQFTGGGPQ